MAAPTDNQPYKKQFLISAYYSPLPGQNRYLRGTYEKDIRLNGRGVAGADGTGVYDGMLAAPKNYAFGTKIFLPSLGIGTVHDRGGAIIAKANYDRIDVWMGYGDAGLTRALNWGMRMIEGTIYPDGANLQDNIDYTWIPTSPSTTINLKTTSAPIVVKNTFTKGLGKNSSGEEVKILQEKLKELGYFDAETTGTYGSQTIESVFAFQKDQGILSSWNEYGAGYFGNTTREKLNKIISQNEQEKVAEKAISDLASETIVEDTKLLITSGLGKDAEGEDVEKLQQTLKDLGYYDGEINGKYDVATIDAVLEFQKEFSLISKDSDYGAGFFGPKTKKALEEALVKKESELHFGELLAEMDFSDNTIIVAFEKQEKPVISKTKVFAVKPKEQLISMTLQKGDQGEIVKELQKKLIKEGYLNIIQETDFFGAMTEEALIQYQIDNGIIPAKNNPGAGIVGPMTRQSLNASLGGLTGV